MPLDSSVKGDNQMALVYCPECGTKVSDKASVCPFCGYRGGRKKFSMAVSKRPLAKIQWTGTELFDQVFPISPIQANNLNIIFGRAENLSRVAPALYEAVKAMVPKTIKVAEVDKAIQKMLDSGVCKFITDKNGEILPSIYGKDGFAAQVRLKDVQLTPDLGKSIADLQTQVALAQVISEIRDVQVGIANLHSELQDDRLALAESAWQQLQQAAQISDARVREAKLLSILSRATDAKCILYRAFANEKPFFDERKNQHWFPKLLDREAQNHGDEKSREIFSTLLAITKAVQIETTVYCLLGEQNVAAFCMKEFSDFIGANSLDSRETLLEMGSYSSSNQGTIIDAFTDIRQKIAALPLNIEETQPLLDSTLREEGGHNNEQVLQEVR